MAEENEEVAMAECGSCRAIVPVDSSECPECGISFSGVSDEALGECGACNALVPLDSTKCPECGVVFVADDVVDILRTWMANNKMDVKTLFGRFDTNNDNMIDSNELREGLLSLNLADLPPSQVDRLVEAIDEDGDSLIDLKELQSIIVGDSIEEATHEEEKSNQENERLGFSENVLTQVMDSNNIEASERESFIAFAQDYNADGNAYLKKEELQAAADAWHTQEEFDEQELQDPEQSQEEIEEESEDTTTEESVVDTEDDNSPEPEDEQEFTEEIVEFEHEDKRDEIHDEEHDESLDDDEELIEESVDVGQDETLEVFETQTVASRSAPEIMDQLLDIIDEQGKSLAKAFGDLDDDGNRMLSRVEVIEKLNDMLPEGLTEDEADVLMDSMDADGDGNIDMIEFVDAIERHEEGIVSIEDEEAETVKTFPSPWQSRAMSKKWHDVFWPLIHASFAILIVGLLVNGLFPFVDGTGGMVELDIRSDQESQFTEWQTDDGKIVSEGDVYPCDPAIQEGKCKNSLTPLAGKASSMPGAFYWDAVVLMTLAGAGLIWSLYTHLILAPGWRARVKAMKDINEDREEVKEAIEEKAEPIDENEVHEANEIEDDLVEDGDEVIDENEEEEGDEFDVGSYVGLEIDGEDYYGTIIEFDDEEGTVVIEEDETGDEIVGYQDEMFIPED